jgi:hypothetical protein
MKKLFLLLLAFCLITVMPAQAQIQLSTETPTEGEPITVTLDKPAEVLLVTYRPNSAVTHRDTFRIQPAASVFEWTPDRAGIVALRVPEQGSKNVSVRFQGLSASGIAVMAIAGALLFGGAAFAFRLLFKDEEKDGTLDIDLDHMPDT